MTSWIGRIKAVLTGGGTGSGGGYEGASTRRRSLRALVTTNGSPAADTLPALPILRARSRSLCMNDPNAIAILNTKVTNAVGTGLVPQSQPDYVVLGWDEDTAAEWAQMVEREFALWAESTDCDSARAMDFYGLQDLVMRSTFMSGDCFTLFRDRADNEVYNLTVRIVEADRCSNPQDAFDTAILAGGIERDNYGAPKAYHFREAHPGTMFYDDKKLNVWKRIPAKGARSGRRLVLHHMFVERPDQPRGVPMLAPIIECLNQLKQYSQAELSAAVVGAMTSVFIESDGTNGNMDKPWEGTPEEENALVDDKELALGAGTVITLADGEKAHLIDPTHPNTAYKEFWEAVLIQASAALELPYEVVLKKFNSNYSASRGALLEAWRHFFRLRSWQVSGFCNPVWSEWMAEAVAIGRIPAPGYFDDPIKRQAYLRCAWIGKGMGHIQPAQEAAAAENRLRIGMTTLAEETAAYSGNDFLQNHAQIKYEDKKRKELTQSEQTQ